MTGAQSSRRARASGFSLIEMLVVVGIIAALSAVSLPNIMGFIQSSRIRNAQDEIASALQRARGRAISSNTQFGVAFIIESPQIYWIHTEDPQPPAVGQPLQTGRQSLNTGAPNEDLSTRHELDSYVRFAVAADSCPTNAAARNQASMRFDRYGVRTFPNFPGAAPTPAPLTVVGATVNGILVTSVTGETSICLVDDRAGLSRLVTVAAGGRVRKAAR